MPIAANAWPSGPVDDARSSTSPERICDAVAEGCDAVLLDLHGAMVTQSHEDGEGELLRRIRAIAPTCRSACRSTCTPTCTKHRATA